MGTCRRGIVIFAIFLAGALLFRQTLSAQNVRIGLFDNQEIKTFVFHCIEGKYSVYGDSVLSREIKKGELVYVSLMGEKLVLVDGDLHFGTFNRLEIKEAGENCNFRLKIVDPVREARNYCGKLEINLFLGTIQLINELPLDVYLAGVVETEAGSTATAEFYKAQAILCRSYALKNREKHPGQNFNLCDNTHCQAFNGISNENPGIPEAVYATHDMVLADENSQIVKAIFHSNSGGETQRASDVWNSGEFYLQSVLDPFSEKQRNALWEKTISLGQWKEYLTRHCKTNISKLADQQLLIRQDHRKKFFIVGTDSLRIVTIREDLDLRSSFFSMEIQNDSILIHGKGYGHGVGMSQEGAMEMGRQGYSYSDILRFYFYNVQIIELADVPELGLPGDFR